MASVERVEDDATAAQDDGLLFNPRTYDPAQLRPGDAAADAGDDRLVRGARQEARSRSTTTSRAWYADFLEFLARERRLRDAADARPRDGRRRPGQALGHRAHLRVQRDPRLLRPRLLVHVAGLDPRPRPDLAERQRGGPRARRRSCSTTARSSPSASPSGSTAPTSTRPTWSSRPTATAASAPTARKYYIGNGNVAGMVSVFGRRADVEGPDGYVFFAADSQHPSYELVKNVVNVADATSASSDLDDYPVRAEDVLHTGAGGLRRRAEHGQRRQVQPRLRLDRHLRARLLRGDHPRRQPRPLRQARSPTSRTCASAFTDAYARLVAMKLFGDRADRLHALAPAPRTAATCSSTRSRR